MDSDRDGVVTRSEWQGQNGAFHLHDTNKDGVLSGTEIWEQGQLPRRGRERAGTPFHDWTAGGFATLDKNNDRRLTADEWRYDRQLFATGDKNGDGVLTRAEFLSQGGTDAQPDQFRTLDSDRDGVIERSEWHQPIAAFSALDRNRDNVITREEYREVAATSGVVERSAAYRAGFERGKIEGRAAGREDRDRNQIWDLEGQRELEGADSGYTASIGDKREYQTGYREGFRQFYGEGWERR